MSDDRTKDQNICYCGNYGGGMHTRSARCPGGELRTPQGEPALTSHRELPGTREPVVIAPKGNAGESLASTSSNPKLRTVEPFHTEAHVSAEVFFGKLGSPGIVVIQADTDEGPADVTLTPREAYDLMLWLQCALSMQPVETPGKWVRLSTEDIPQNAPVMMRRKGSPQIPMWEVWQPLEPAGKPLHDEECVNCGAPWSRHLTNKLICPDAAIADIFRFGQKCSPEKASAPTPPCVFRTGCQHADVCIRAEQCESDFAKNLRKAVSENGEAEHG